MMIPSAFVRRNILPCIRSSSGITMVELLMTAAILGMLFAVVIPLFTVTNRGYTSLEVNTVLTAGGQNALNKIEHRLVESKRIFSNTVADNLFLAKVTPNLSASVLTNSRLPIVNSNASISPSSSAFSAANVGNSLFFASIDAPQDLTNVADVSAATHTVRIDRYVFNYYYLSPDASTSFGSGSRINLWEWHSIDYADYLQLTNILDTTERGNTIKKLVLAGVLYAWDSSTGTATAAFYTLDSSGLGSMSVTSAHTILKSTTRATDKYTPDGNMVKLMRGVTTGGFRYSVAPNTTTITLRHTVPVFGAVSGLFPSGFEVQAVGANVARQVFIRLVLAAKGNFIGYASHEEVLMIAARDIW